MSAFISKEALQINQQIQDDSNYNKETTTKPFKIISNYKYLKNKEQPQRTLKIQRKERKLGDFLKSSFKWRGTDLHKRKMPKK